MKPIKLHWTAPGKIYAACGLEMGMYAAATSNAKDVTCGLCLRSTVMKNHHPELTLKLAKPSGRPAGKGVQRAFKVYLPTELSEWLNALDSTHADVIRQALTEYKATRHADRVESFTDRIQVVMTAEISNLIDEPTLINDHGGNLIGVIRQIEAEDSSVLGCLATAPTVVTFQYIKN